MIWRRGFIWYILLLAVNVLLMVGIVYVWWGDEAGPTVTRAKDGVELPKPPVLRDNQPLTAFKLISTKNLFSQDRTGPEEGAPAGKAEATLEGRKLLGIIIIGDDKAALISSSTGQAKGPRGLRSAGQEAQIEVVRQGEEWEGFKVMEISSEQVVFQGKEGTKTLNFPD